MAFPNHPFFVVESFVFDGPLTELRKGVSERRFSWSFRNSNRQILMTSPRMGYGSLAGATEAITRICKMIRAQNVWTHEPETIVMKEARDHDRTRGLERNYVPGSSIYDMG